MVIPKTRQINAIFLEKDYKKIEARAERGNMSLANWVREGILAYLEVLEQNE